MYQSYPATEDATGEIVLKNFRKIPSTYSGFGKDEAPPYDFDSSVPEEHCHGTPPESNSLSCSPLLNFHKHLFGSLKLRRRFDSGLPTARSETRSVIEISRSSTNEHTGNSDEYELKQDEQLKSEGDTNRSDATVESKSENKLPIDTSMTSSPEACHSFVNLNAEHSNERCSHEKDTAVIADDNNVPVLLNSKKAVSTNTNICEVTIEAKKFSPPMLKRREKGKTGEFVESRKSRLSMVAATERECLMPPPVGDPPSSTEEFDEPDSCQINLISDNQLEVIMSSNQTMGFMDYDQETLTEKGTVDSNHPRDAEKNCENVSEDKENWSSPDVDLDIDFEEKESGYTTLEDAVAQNERNKSSCSSEDRDGDYTGRYYSLSATGVIRKRRIPSSYSSSGVPCSESSVGASQLPSSETTVLASNETVGDCDGTSVSENLRQYEQGSHVHLRRTGDKYQISTDSVNGAVHSDPMVDQLTRVSQYISSNIARTNGIAQSVYRPKSMSGVSDKSDIQPNAKLTPRRQQPMNDGVVLARRSIALDDEGRRLFQSGGSCVERSITSMLSESEEDNSTLGSQHSNTTLVENDELEYLPPLPTRNYDLYNMTMSDNVHAWSTHGGGDLLHGVEDSDAIHMSWDEVMNEARSLGIPLQPQSQHRRSSTSSTGTSSSDVRLPLNGRSDASLLDRITPLSKRSPGSRRTRNHPDPSSMVKSTSPFRDRFRLMNPFTRKDKMSRSVGRSASDVVDRGSLVHRFSSEVNVQHRGLPVPPKPPRQLSASPLSSTAGADTDGDQMPSPDPREASRWAGSSLSIPYWGGDVPSAGGSWGSCQSVPMHFGLSVSDSSGSVSSVFSRSSYGYAGPPYNGAYMYNGAPPYMGPTVYNGTQHYNCSNPYSGAPPGPPYSGTPPGPPYSGAPPGPPYSAPVVQPSIQEALFRGFPRTTSAKDDEQDITGNIDVFSIQVKCKILLLRQN